MSSRDRKEETLKDNIRICTKRAVIEWEKSNRKRCPKSEENKIRRMFMKSAKNIDRTKLHEVWNA